MRTWWTLVLFAEGLTSFWLHSMLVGLARDGRLDEMCLLQRGTAPSKGLSTILRVTGVFFVLKSVIHALIYLAALLMMLTASGIVDADAEPYPFSSPEYNLTVAQDMICTHVVPSTDNNYANVTEAIELCPDSDKSHIYYCNRATARCEIGMKLESDLKTQIRVLDSAVLDCDESLKLESTYVKASFRRGFCNGLARFFEEKYAEVGVLLVSLPLSLFLLPSLLLPYDVF